MHSIGSRPVMLLFEKNPGEATKKIPSLGSGESRGPRGLLQGVCLIKKFGKVFCLTTLLLEALL